MRVMTLHRRDTARSDTRPLTCDDLHDAPYDVAARAAMLELLKEGVPAGPALRARQR